MTSNSHPTLPLAGAVQASKPTGVHPTMAAYLAPFAPPETELRVFTVRIGRSGAPRLEFPAMSRSSAECAIQHMDLCEVGERCEIVPAASRELLRAEVSALPCEFNRSCLNRADLDLARQFAGEQEFEVQR